MHTCLTWVATPAAVASLLLAACGSGASSTSAGGGGTTSTPGATTSVGRQAPTTSQGLATTTAPPTTVAPASAPSWPSYHSDLARTGAVPAGASLQPAHSAWSAALGGKVYGQPVAADGRIFAATETNRVVALDPRSGSVLWSASVGTPLTAASSVIGCGDIDPLGVTSTPVVDAASGTVYVVGEVSTGGGALHHQLVGYDVATGAVRVSDDVDPPLGGGQRSASLLQRAGLVLANGRVYIAYGGSYGDCGTYHGWVVGVNETGPADEEAFEVASDGQGGAIWQSGGAPAVDGAGNLYVSTGNANPDPPEGGPDPKAYTESVVKLSAALAPLASFKDTVAGGDEDLSTGNPVLLPDGELFAVGKTDVGYVLRQSDLSRVAAISGVCGSDPDGGPAYDQATDTLFVPCQDGGIQMVDLSTDKVGKRLSGANGAPILIGNGLWALHYPAGTLVDYDAATGATLQTLGVGSGVASFTSPSAAYGLLLVPTTTGVTAFAGPAGVTG